MANVIDFAGLSNDAANQGWASLSPGPLPHCPLITNFRNSLLAKGALLEEMAKAGSNEARILADVKRDIAVFPLDGDGKTLDWKPKAWEELSRMELFLMLTVPAKHLYTELAYRLSIAEKVGVKNIICLNKMVQQLTANVNLRDESTWPPEAANNLRFLLIDVVKETQREQIRKHLSRVFLKEVTRQLLIAGLISLGLFLLPYLLFRAGIFGSSVWSDVVPIWTCLSAGLFGAYFSRLLYLQKTYMTLSYEELISSRDTLAILLRGSIGACGAALVFFLLLSGVVTGTFIPHQTIELNPPTDAASKDLALLFVWGFFAGFSERLVPNILTSTEQHLVSTEPSRP